MLYERSGNTLYLECYSGISGDMTVGALLDLGADRKLLEEQLRSLPVGGFEIEISRVKKSGLDACDFRVILDKEHENHDHDNAYLYGHRHAHGEEEIHVHEGHVHGRGEEALQMHERHVHVHAHGEEGLCVQEGHVHRHGEEGLCVQEGHVHVHGGEELHVHEGHMHGHAHGEGVHAHEHRGLPEIKAIIHNSRITPRAKAIADKIFTVLAEAEAKAHGTAIEEVHFHEVGAVDSIVDVIAAAICLDNLNITEVIVPELYEGRGTVRCQHGIIPIPVPAVVNIVEQYGISMHMTETKAELVTPTGAAIVAAVRTSSGLPERYKIGRIGMGAGKRDYGRASVLRGMLIEPEAQESDYIYKLESNIDDCTGEALGYVLERLLEAGARDVHYTPVYMKKNRPAYQLNVICSEEKVSEMEEIIFRETTTIGIRKMKMERSILKREIRKITTSLGEAEVKICETDGNTRVYPEYESAAAISREAGLPYREVWDRISREAGGLIGNEGTIHE